LIRGTGCDGTENCNKSTEISLVDVKNSPMAQTASSYILKKRSLSFGQLATLGQAYSLLKAREKALPLKPLELDNYL
jgi:hypothetical protein